jgi:hypothetical protein
LCFENQKYSSALGKHPAATPALRVVVIAVIHNLFYVQLNDFSPCCRDDDVAGTELESALLL